MVQVERSFNRPLLSMGNVRHRCFGCAEGIALARTNMAQEGDNSHEFAQKVRPSSVTNVPRWH
jgi:hypothetical protein